MLPATPENAGSFAALRTSSSARAREISLPAQAGMTVPLLIGLLMLFPSEEFRVAVQFGASDVAIP